MLLEWQQAASAGPAVAGGKGWNLGRMARFGFPVPPGVVIPASASLTGEISEELRAALQPWAERNLAVRSSATLEDGATASFAGIHESVLNVTGLPALEEAILTCWRSLHSERARAYRQRQGLAEAEVCCAVILCDMLPARASGVAFTFDPISGQRDRMVCEVVAGLAEGLVQGRVTPGRVTLRRTRLDYPILEREGDLVLAEALWNRFGRLLDRLHWALGEGQDPLDVEWVYAHDQFWLVQARPVVRPARITYEGVRGQPILWSSANMSDSVPGVVSTLSWSLIQQAVEPVLCAPLRACGYPVPEGLEVARRFQGRGYFDYSSMMWAFYDALGVLPQKVSQQVGGAHPVIQVPPGSPFRGSGWRRILRLLRLLARLWKTVNRLDEDLDLQRAAVQAQDARLGPVESKPLAALRDFLWQAHTLHAAYESLAGLSNTSSGGWYDALADNMAKLFGEAAPSMTSRLLAGCGGVTSAEHAYRIFEMAQLAEPEAHRLLATSNDWTRLPQGSPFRLALESFLAEFGHRAVYEADIANPRWSEDPTFILEEVRRWWDAPIPFQSPRQRAREIRKLAEVELRSRAGWRGPLVFFLLRRVRRAMALRERAKSELVRAMLTHRRVLLELGRRLQRAGHLGEVVQVFDFAYPDLTAYVTGEWDGRGADALTRERARQRQEWLLSRPPEVIVEQGSELTTPPPSAVTGEGWKGQGVSGGLVRGRARILRSPQEGCRLLPGEILVAPTTDPGWTPVFLRASGIVVETGGYLSHGAIVAREFGLPAVVNLPGIVDALQDGVMLEVDGRRGSVRVVPPEKM